MAEEEVVGKQDEKFNAEVRRLAGLIGGYDKLIPSKKVTADAADELINDLFHEEKVKNHAEAKKALKELLEKYALFQKELKEKLKEIDNLKKTKMDDFIKSAQLVFQRFDGVNERVASYYDGLKLSVTKEETNQN